MASPSTLPTPPPGPKYNVVALISGGKDSFFSLLHCLANGHKLVALANLHPSPSAPSEELDSYMYQTVGHRLVPLYEQALGVPLYRGVIRGGRGAGGRDYVHRASSQEGMEEEADETEDLIPLLTHVLTKHPEINAISTGAILSTYQRTRIESIAARLRLTPLAFLWQYPSLPPYDQAGLLADMTTVGQDSRIVKVASAGLADDAFLWRNVADPATVARMKAAMRRFAVNGDGCVLGEGGEYETLTLDGPRGVWKGRVVVDGAEGYVVDGGDGKEVEGRVEMKGDDVEEEDEGGLEGLRIPSIWDDEFERVLRSNVLVDSSSNLSSSADDNDTPSSNNPPFQPFNIPPSTLSFSGTTFTYPNITSPSPSPTPESQLTSLLTHLTTALTTHSLDPSQITHCTLLLRHMHTFTSLNAVYAAYFSSTNPPSRATFAIGALMPSGIDVMLSVIGHRLPHHPHHHQREGLHVQSQSYWAPANIGPYSQAISIPLVPSSPSPSTSHTKEVHIAGQIPLLPSSLTLLSASLPPSVPELDAFAQSALLALQHLTRIARCVDVGAWTAGVALIPRIPTATPSSPSSDDDTTSRVHIIHHIWRALHSPTFYSPTSSTHSENDDENEEEVDPWDVLNRHHSTPAFPEKTIRRRIPSPSSTSSRNHGVVPPLVVAQVEALPKGAEIEWCCVGVSSADVGVSTSLSTTTTRVTVRGPDGEGEVVYAVRQQTAADTHEAKGMGGEEEKEWVYGTLYTSSPSFSSEVVREGGTGMRNVQIVPCFRVWKCGSGEGEVEVGGVVVGRVS